jgi:integrase/DNA-binding XRE family transcriptional regulator
VTVQAARPQGRKSPKLLPVELARTPSTMLVSEAMAGWLKDSGQEWSKVWRDSVGRFVRKTEQLLPGVDVEQLKPRDVAAIKRCFEVHHHEGNRYLSALSSAWRWAAANGAVEGANPVAAIKRYRERAPNYVVGDETPAVLLLGIDACEREGELQDVFADCFRLVAHTGRRISEIRNVRVEWVDLRARTLRIPLTKIGRAQSIPLGEAALEIVRRRIVAAKREGTAWLFSTAKTRELDRPLQKTQAQWRRVPAWLESQGLPGRRSDGRAWKLADLRAIAATLMSRNAGPFAVAEALGHLSISTTYRYVRRDMTAAREAVVSYEEHFLKKGKDGRDALEVIAERMRARREELGMTQDAVAEAASVSRVSITNFEAGKIDMRVSSLVAVAGALKIDAGALMRGIPG